MDAAGYEKFENITQPGHTGLNTILDPQDVADSDVVDIRNMVFNGGYLVPRQGFQQVFAKPTGETGTPNTLIFPTTSDSVYYTIAVYGSNFYLWDSTNSQTILLNTGSGITYTTTPSFWTWTNWNAGTGTDVVYIGNGKDNTTKWQMSLTTLASSVASADTHITLTDGTRFPATGTVIVQAVGGSPVSKAWTSKTGTNQLNFGSGFGSNIASGASVTIALAQTANVPVSSIIVTYGRRLFAIGGSGTESAINYSKVNTPEDFTTTTGPNGAGAENLADGNGPITAAQDRDTFLLIGKSNSWSQFSFIYSSDSSISTKIVALNEMTFGEDSGTLSEKTIITTPSGTSYLTHTGGIMEMVVATSQTTGTSTGGQSISYNIISEKINNLIQPGGTYANFTHACGAYWGQKGFWALSSTANSTNNIILVYDYLYQYWTIFEGWNVTDMGVSNNSLYFLSNTDGSVNQCFTSYQDGSAGYNVYNYSKRFDFGEPSIPKTTDKIFLQGIISENTNLYIDVLFNEAGSLGKQTYKISGMSNAVYIAPVGAIGQYALGTAPIGSVQVQNTSPLTLNYFRVYLDIASQYGFYNIQIKPYSTDIGSFWAIDKIGFNPIVENSYPTSLVIGPQ